MSRLKLPAAAGALLLAAGLALCSGCSGMAERIPRGPRVDRVAFPEDGVICYVTRETGEKTCLRVGDCQ